MFTADPLVVPDARQHLELSHEEMLLLAGAGAAVVQPRAAELALAYDIDIHVRSMCGEGAGTWIRKAKPELEQRRLIGVGTGSAMRSSPCAARRPQPSRALSRSGASPSARSCDATTRCASPRRMPSRPMSSRPVRAAGSNLLVDEELGAVSLVGIGIGTHPEICAHALDVLERMGVEPQLVKTALGQISFHVQSATVPDAVRAFHDAFGLREDRTVEEVLKHGVQSRPVASYETESQRT